MEIKRKKVGIELQSNRIFDIVQMCLSINIEASRFYTTLAGSPCFGPKQKMFWKDMARHEKEQIPYWQALLDLSQKNMITDIFDDPQRIYEELTVIRDKVRAMVIRTDGVNNMEKGCLCAFQMEFYLLHPALETLFQYMKIIPGEESPQSVYEAHIQMFLDTFYNCDQLTPEMELLAEALERLAHNIHQLANQRSIDEMTKVYNRQSFFSMLQPLAHFAKRNKINIGIMLVDVDNFKIFNEMYGRKQGDKALLNVAQIIKSHLRASDVIGRYGGTKFIVYLSALEKEAAFMVSEKIRKLVEETSRGSLPVTVSIGIAQGILKNDEEDEISKRIQHAEKCLTQAKEKGRNQVILQYKEEHTGAHYKYIDPLQVK